MKKVLSALLLGFISMFMTGCDLKGEVLGAENIRTSVYPIEFVTNYLYGFEASVKSIYPDGADYHEYDITDKLIENYSKADLFIYNGASDEKKIAAKFLNNNEYIGIIDAMQGMNYKYAISELWLDPSNLLMAASNIKNGLLQISPNKVTSEKITENYNDLKIEMSKLDVELNTLLTDASSSVIVAGHDVFNYLTKYGVEVIVLNENNSNLTRAYNNVKNLVKNKKVKYIYLLEDHPVSDELNKFIKDNGLTKINIKPLGVLSEEDRNNKEDYLTIMSDIITQYKKELHK